MYQLRFSRSRHTGIPERAERPRLSTVLLTGDRSSDSGVTFNCKDPLRASVRTVLRRVSDQQLQLATATTERSVVASQDAAPVHRTVSRADVRHIAMLDVQSAVAQ